MKLLKRMTLFYVINMLYEVTMTLRPFMYRHSAKDQANIVRRLLKDLFLLFKISAVMELTHTANVHVHSIVELASLEKRSDFMDYFRSKEMMKSFGRMSCTQVQYYASYCTYMRKDIPDTHKIIGDPVLVDHFGVLRCYQVKDDPNDLYFIDGRMVTRKTLKELTGYDPLDTNGEKNAQANRPKETRPRIQAQGAFVRSFQGGKGRGNGKSH